MKLEYVLESIINMFEKAGVKGGHQTNEGHDIDDRIVLRTDIEVWQGSER